MSAPAAATIEVPQGIDPGFGYNVGEASWGRGEELVKLEGHGAWTLLEAPGGRRPRDPGPLAAVAPRAELGRRAQGETALRAVLRAAIGGDSRILADPTGERVAVGQAIVDHMLAHPARRDGREAFFPFIPELIETPAEIWVGFAASRVSGRVSLRRRYVKLLRLDKTRVIALVADSDGGQWSGMTFFRGSPKDVDLLRRGLRVFE
ncbi:MAG: PBECR2 nuclease fold domain-containing protein [Rhodospirillales bacterium]